MPSDHDPSATGFVPMAQYQALEKRHAALEKKFDDYLAAKQKEETQRLRTALIAAGGVVSVLLSFIWVEIIWPAISAMRGNP